MPKVALFNQSGSQVGEIELNDSVFGIEPHTHVLHEAVLMQRASMRQGTHKVKDVLKYEAVEESHGVKRYWPRTSEIHPFTTMGWRWNSFRTDSTQLQHKLPTKKFVV